MKISQNKSVALSYELFVGEEQELMEKATTETPLRFIFGTNSMLPAFEKEVEGLQVGDTFDFVIPVEQAYGDYDDSAIVELPKNIFEVEGKVDEAMVYEGAVLPMMDTNGQRLQGQVVSITDTTVTMDFNHPLAGENLHFVGKVEDVKEATAEEIAAMFSGGGCGCGSGCGCGDEDDSSEGGCCGGGCGCH